MKGSGSKLALGELPLHKSIQGLVVQQQLQKLKASKLQEEGRLVDHGLQQEFSATDPTDMIAMLANEHAIRSQFLETTH